LKYVRKIFGSFPSPYLKLVYQTDGVWARNNFNSEERILLHFIQQVFSLPVSSFSEGLLIALPSDGRILCYFSLLNHLSTTRCSMEKAYRYLRGTYCLHHQDKIVNSKN
jgi:hypothetical protein